MILKGDTGSKGKHIRKVSVYPFINAERNYKSPEPRGEKKKPYHPYHGPFHLPLISHGPAFRSSPVTRECTLSSQSLSSPRVLSMQVMRLKLESKRFTSFSQAITVETSRSVTPPLWSHRQANQWIDGDVQVYQGSKSCLARLSIMIGCTRGGGDPPPSLK